MKTIIRTSSENKFQQIQKYLKSHRVHFVPSSDPDSYALFIIESSSSTLDSLLSRMTHYLHLTPHTQQEPRALAA